MAVLRRGKVGTVVAVGPMLDRVLAATSALDVTVLYASTVRPFDATTLRATLARADVVLVEPYLAGTSAATASAALVEVPHRVLSLGVRQAELRRYGTVADHDRAHGLDVGGLAESISRFLRP
jgi:transketolase